MSAGQVPSSLELDNRVILLHVARKDDVELIAIPFLDAVDAAAMLYRVIEDMHAGHYTEYVKG